MRNTLLIKNARAVLPTGVSEPLGVLLSDGKIRAIGYEGSADRELDAKGGYLMAGFVDIHVHGGGGADFMDATPEAFAQATRTHLAHGTTLLYPTAMSATEEDLAETKTKVLLQTKVPASDDERELLASVGCDPDRCRNITPEYWYGRTGLRLFVFGGRAVLVDPELGRGVLLLPEAYSLMSAAICGEAGDMSFYFTAAYDGEFSLWKYRDGEVMRLVVSETDCLAVTEPFEGGYEKVGLYNAMAREDERFVVALECIGERLCEYTAD